MSLISNIEAYEGLAKNLSLNHITSQFSGVVLVDYISNIFGDVEYKINDNAVRFSVLETSDLGPTVVKKTQRAWALPGYILEGVRSTNIDPGIQLPTLPTGTVSTKPKDIVLITTIPLYWYPTVPDGDKLLSYDLRFDIPFLEIKNNRQYFKVAQNNVLEEGVIAIQLSNYPAQRINIGNPQGTSDFLFT